jgi:diguanylate cyclase (GGDEF)-like protein/PAS domain S-box-containing protein
MPSLGVRLGRGSGSAVSRQTATLAAAVAAAALAATYLALSADAVRASVWATAGVATALLVLQRTRGHRPADALASYLLAAGIGLVCLGQAVELGGQPSPSLADLPRLLAYPTLAAALIRFQRHRIRHDRSSLLDALIITVAAAQAGWLVLLEPALRDDSSSLATLAVTGAYPLGDLLVVGFAARLALSLHSRSDRAARALVLGLAVGMCAEIAADIANEPTLAVGWLAACVLVATAVLHPTYDAVPAPESRQLASPWRFAALLGLACLVSPVLILTHPVNHQPTTAAVVLGGALLLCGLALVRIVMLMNHLRSALRREHVLRAATSALVGAADRSAVRDCALRAAMDLVASPGARSWRIDGDPGGTVARATDDVDPATFLDSAELALFPNSETGIGVLTGLSLLHATLGVPSTHALVVIALPMRGAGREAAVIAAVQPPSDRTIASLESLARTMALALERLDVGEILLERRSERRLRLMLQYASDVILILDHDLTIVHVTPAVEPIIGMPAPELLGMNWLEVVTARDREAGHDLVSLAQGGRPARGELRLNTADGHARHVDAVVTEVIDEDLMGFVVTCHDVTERHDLEQQLTHQAFHDALTGLANRALFRDRLGHAMARSRGSASYGVLFIDLDDFKTVNDSLGHAAGDQLLREMTTRLRSCLREADTAARLGGDEFAILLEDVDGDEDCVEIAERLLARLAEPFDVAGTEVSTSASIGIARGLSNPRGPALPEDLMRNADLALYEAKKTGKNRYAVFAPTMHEAALTRLSLTSDLRHALERGEIEVFYQPLVDLETGHIDGLEALSRWHHPEHGIMLPGNFIPLAEETGLIVPLGRTVLRTAVNDVVRWQREHADHRTLHMAVNVSGRQLQDPGFVDDVREIVASSGIDPATLVLEITESVLLPGDLVIMDRLNALSAIGLHLYIDDFGTGYSSLSYLQTLPVNGLKLAQEFVEALPGTGSESGLVRTIRDLADTLGLGTIVAEGIERPEQWSSLLSLGYRVGQGFHLAVPMPASRIPDFLSGANYAGDGDWERTVQAEAEKAAETAAVDGVAVQGSAVEASAVEGSADGLAATIPRQVTAD